MKCNILQRGKKNESGSQHNKEQVQKRNEIFPQAFSDCEAPLDGERLLRRNDGMEAEPVEIDAPEICHCYDLWKYSAPCKHCIALEAVRSRKKKSASWRLWGNDIYQVIVKISGNEWKALRDGAGTPSG